MDKAAWSGFLKLYSLAALSSPSEVGGPQTAPHFYGKLPPLEDLPARCPSPCPCPQTILCNITRDVLTYLAHNLVFPLPPATLEIELRAFCLLGKHNTT
jgi:hypothetical protein